VLILLVQPICGSHGLVEPKTLIAAIHTATDDLELLYKNLCNFDSDEENDEYDPNDDDDDEDEDDEYNGDHDLFFDDVEIDEVEVVIVEETDLSAKVIGFSSRQRRGQTDEDLQCLESEQSCDALKKSKILHGEQGFVSYDDFEIFNNQKMGPTWGDFVNLELFYDRLSNDDKIEKAQSAVASIAELLDAAHDEAFYLANFQDPHPQIEGFFVRQLLLYELCRLERKHTDLMKIVPRNELLTLKTESQDFINHWGSIKHMYVAAIILLSTSDTSPPEFLRSLSHTLWYSSRYGLRKYFPNANSLDIYKDSSLQFGRPILSAYQLRKDEPIRPCELHTVLRVAQVFNDRILVIFDELTKHNVEGVNFVAFRRACRKHGFEVKDHMFKKRKYFKNVNADAFQKLLRLLHGGASYLPEPYKHVIYSMSSILELLISVYRSVDPLVEFGYDNIKLLYRELVVSPILLLHRLLVTIFPSIVRGLGKAATNTHCIDWCTRKFNDLISEHADQFYHEVAKCKQVCLFIITIIYYLLSYYYLLLCIIIYYYLLFIIIYY